MPLLHVMGVTATNQSFSLCFCFMQRETEADYLWALKEMKSYFDNWIQDDITIVTDRELALMGVGQLHFLTRSYCCACGT